MRSVSKKLDKDEQQETQTKHKQNKKMRDLKVK